MEYDEMLTKIYKEKKIGRGERFVPPDVEIQQNGQRTIISIERFANYVNRPLLHIAKYLMHELTAPGQLDNGKLIMGGKFSKQLVQAKINSYLKEYVICKQCASPDTQMVKTESGLSIKCLGCGAEYPVGKIK